MKKISLLVLFVFTLLSPAHAFLSTAQQCNAACTKPMACAGYHHMLHCKAWRILRRACRIGGVQLVCPATTTTTSTTTTTLPLDHNGNPIVTSPVIVVVPTGPTGPAGPQGPAGDPVVTTTVPDPVTTTTTTTLPRALLHNGNHCSNGAECLSGRCNNGHCVGNQHFSQSSALDSQGNPILCLTKTPNFWAVHPTVTDNFLPI